MRNVKSTRAGAVASQTSRSRRRPVLTLALLAGWLTATTAHCAPATVSLISRNQIARPYPSDYQRERLNQLAAKSSPPAPRAMPLAWAGDKKRWTVASREAAPKPTAVELIAAAPVGRKAAVPVEKVAARPERSPLVDAIIGREGAAQPGQSFRIGYGRMIADNSRPTGVSNGTTREEPSCLYVKTTVRF